MREREREFVKGCNVRRFEIQNVERTKWGLTTLVPHDEGIVRCCIGTVPPRHVEVQGLMWVGPIVFVERYNNKVIKRHEAFAVYYLKSVIKSEITKALSYSFNLFLYFFIFKFLISNIFINRIFSLMSLSYNKNICYIILSFCHCNIKFYNFIILVFKILCLIVIIIIM